MKRSVACILMNAGRVLVGKRVPGGQMGGRWEFPGGKVEEGESQEEAIIREFLEEFSVPVSVGPLVARSVFQYNDMDVQLEGYEVFLETEEPRWVLTEHTEIRWVPLEEIPSLHFVDSDMALYQQLLEHFARKVE